MTVFCSANVIGQTSVYHSFPDSSFWRVDASDMDNLCGGGYCYHYYIAGDTIINSNTYRQIYRSKIVELGNPCGTWHWFLDTGYVGALRDDSIANKVFFVLPTLTSDTLLYDYNLNVGDTVKGYLAAECANIVISSKDSININGLFHKRWFFDTFCSSSFTGNFIIEGVGTEYGLIEPIPDWFQKNSAFVCLHDSAGTIFTNTNWNPYMSCQLITSINNPHESIERISFFPNPFSQQTTLQSNKALNNATLNIYNSFGQQVKTIIHISANAITLYSDNLTNGLYFIRLTQDNKVVTEDKLIICDQNVHE